MGINSVMGDPNRPGIIGGFYFFLVGLVVGLWSDLGLADLWFVSKIKS